jgi:hypothetical protein
MAPGLGPVLSSSSPRAGAGRARPGTPRPPTRGLGMPAHLFVGLEAHRLIGEFYKERHPPPEVVFVNFTPLGSIAATLADQFPEYIPSEIEKLLAGLRPDIADLGGPHPPWVYEIKPLSLFQVGALEARLYASALWDAGIPADLGPAGAAGTSGVVHGINRSYTFACPTDGVIGYTSRQRQPVPVPVPAPQLQPVEQRQRTWRLQEALQPLAEQARRFEIPWRALAEMMFLLLAAGMLVYGGGLILAFGAACILLGITEIETGAGPEGFV